MHGDRSIGNAKCRNIDAADDLRCDGGAGERASYLARLARRILFPHTKGDFGFHQDCIRISLGIAEMVKRKAQG